MLFPVYPGNGWTAVHQLTSCSLFHVLNISSIHPTFQLIVPCFVVSCFLQMNCLVFLFLAMCVFIRCFVLSANCYRYFLAGLIFFNKARSTTAQRPYSTSEAHEIQRNHTSRDTFYVTESRDTFTNVTEK
jgi:hypothetical protein